MRGQLASVADVSKYMLAGNATLTIRSQKTDSRFTYRVNQARDRETNELNPEFFFVAMLTGSNNEEDFQYLGHFDTKRMSYRHGVKSKIGPDSSGAKAFAWFFGRVFQDGQMPKDAEIWHEGRCGRCGRKLTVPESIAQGFGPECVNHVGKEEL
jgi:hypothetical protein